jgi:serine/threonine protein kinase
MEAMAYLHQNNIYYGDMKPENLLLFKDYKIKLGDLGISLKIPASINEETTLYLKGLTVLYSLPEMSKLYYDDKPVTVKELMLND